MDLLEELFELVAAALKDGSKLGSLGHLILEYEGIDWKPYKYFTPVHYSRYIFRLNEMLEMVIICWEPGQKWELHDHPREGELIRIMQGDMVINKFELLNKPVMVETRKLHSGETIFMQGNQFGHELFNDFSRRAVTLHLCSPPNFRPGFY